VKEQDSSIDEYHDQELSLRQQLNTRVNVMDSLQKELYLANNVVGDLRGEVQEKEVSNERLQSALEGYRDEVKGLENLIERMEKEGQHNEQQLRGEMNEMQERLQHEVLKHDTTRASDEGKDMIIIELERRLTAALEAASEVQAQLAALGASKDAEISTKQSAIERLKSSGLEREREHGDALALRDARVSELREEVERVNNALKAAHTTILELRKENKELKAQVSGEKSRGLFVVQAMRDQLTRALETGIGYVNGDVSVQGPSREGSSPVVGESSNSLPVVRRGRFLDGDLARKSGKKRRRYDSGLGFLEEEHEGEMEVGI
jgi:chromosome segregation ATPase